VIWRAPPERIIACSHLQRGLDAGTSAIALAIRRHLEEESGGQVWSWPEMLHDFKVYDSTPPDEFGKRIGDLSGWWVAQEPGVGEVRVIRKVDKAKGTLLFKDNPRFYFCWHPEK